MSLIETLKGLLGKRVDGQKNDAQPPDKPILLPFTEEDRCALRQMAGEVSEAIRKARDVYFETRTALFSSAQAAFEAAARKRFGDIPDTFRGTYRGVPGLFLCLVREIPNAERAKDANEMIYGVAMQAWVQIQFVPLLFDGTPVRCLNSEVWLEYEDVKHVALWPEEKPWPGKPMVTTFSGLGES